MQDLPDDLVALVVETGDLSLGTLLAFSSTSTGVRNIVWPRLLQARRIYDTLHQVAEEVIGSRGYFFHEHVDRLKDQLLAHPVSLWKVSEDEMP